MTYVRNDIKEQTKKPKMPTPYQLRREGTVKEPKRHWQKMKSERKCSVPFSPPFSLSLGLFFSPVFCFVAEAGIEKVARRRVNVDAMALNEGTHTKTNSPTILQTPRDLRQVETSFSDRKLADRFTSFWKMFPTQPRRFVVCPVLVCF